MSAEIVTFPKATGNGVDDRLRDMHAVIDATAPLAREMGLQRFVEAMVTVAKVAAAENADSSAAFAGLFRKAAGDLVRPDA